MFVGSPQAPVSHLRNSLLLFPTEHYKFHQQVMFVIKLGGSFQLTSILMLPPKGGTGMTTKEIADRIKDTDKISVSDPDHAADEIVPSVIKNGILFYDNGTPIIKMPLHYQRIKSANEDAFVFNMLDEKSQIVVPFKEIKETTKRLRYIPELQVDLTE